MRFLGLVFAIVLRLPLALPAQERAAPTPEQLQGSWKLVSLTYDGEPQTAIGYMLFAGDRYAFVTTRQRPPLTREVNDKAVDQLTSDEKDLYVQAYRSMTAAAGPYSIEKGEILYSREVVRSPHLAGTAEHRRSWIEGPRLIQDFQGGGRRQVYVWERVGVQGAAPLQRFEKLAEGVYAALPAPGSDVSANSGFVIGKDSVWVFDALRPEVATAMLAQIRMLTSAPVKFVVNSHHHYELVLGNGVFAGATIVTHENARKNLLLTPPDAQMERTRASLKQLGLPPEARPAATTPVPVATLTYQERIVFHDGDRELHLIHLGRYHTDGDSVLFLPRERILFSGDLLPGLGGPGGQREAHFRDFIASIDRALALDFDTIVPGRGERLATKADLRRFQEYLKALLSQVQGFVDRGATLEETLARVQPPGYIDATRLATASFKRLWADSVRRAYAELTADKAGRRR
jgi:glyoxylase-like metal-dependent hydrolase (beta-lactamase superfamily II)